MKKYRKYGLILILVVVATSVTLYMKSIKEKENQEIINIKDLSKEFLDEYFEKATKLDELNNQENILIVTTTKKIKNTYGAIEVVEAPNNQYLLQYKNSESKNYALEKLQADESLISVEENAIHYLTENNEEADISNNLHSTISYNSWGIQAMWLNSAIATANELDLNEVTVAVIDSGCDVELFNKYYSGRLAGTYYTRNGSTDVTDRVGHGTHVTGTIAEGTPENVSIYSIKVTELGIIFTTDVIKAMNYIVANDIAKVVNMSFGSTRYSESEYIAIEAAAKENIIVLAAAGNSGTSEEEYPAAFDNTIAISSVNSELNISSFSNYGSYIDFAAPGTGIKSISSVKMSENDDGDADHETISGTSMATPHAAAAVAILKGLNVHLSKEQTIDILENNAKDLGEPGWDMYYGHGLISFENFNFDNFTIVKNDDEPAELTSFEIIDQPSPTVNYLNETNFMNFKIRLNYDNMYYYTKYLWEIADDIEILNYDPLSQEYQEVTIKYNDLEITFEYINAEEIGWKYDTIGETECVITGIKQSRYNNHAYYALASNDDEFYLPKRVYVPDNIYGFSVTGIQNNTFGYNLDAVFLPSTVEWLGPSSFENSKVKKVISEAEQIYVGDNAFKNAYTLEIFNAKISNIGIGAFNNCYAIDNIELSNDIETIYENTFYNSVNLETINIPTSTISIGNNAFNNTKIKDLYIPASTTYISQNAFLNSKALETITVDSGNPIYDSRENSNILIDTATNTVILGSGHATIPNTVVKIGNSSFINNKILENLNVPNSVTEIERWAFYGCDNIKEVYIDKSVRTLETESFFNVKNGIIYIVGPYDLVTAGKLKAGFNNYKFLEPTSITVDGPLATYNAFDRVENNLTITLNYNGDIKNVDETLTETITDNYEITYANGSDSFRYGDTYFTVSFTTKHGITINKDISVTVNKTIPAYNIPNNITGKIGEELSEIELPEGFEWMNPSEVIEESGEQIYRAKYIPEDTNNYEIVEDIAITIQVEQGMIITNNTTDAEIVYDGEDHTINIDIDLDNYKIVYSLDGETYDLNEIPKFKEIGEHTVYYKITALGYNILKSSNKVLIYGIEEIDSSIVLKDDVLIVRNDNSFVSISNKIRTFAKENYNDIVHYDANNNRLDENIVKTSDIALINITDTTSYLYHISIVGDVNGDGKISSADYVKIRKHIMQTETITKNYFVYAADINNDTKISSADYVQIRKYIMNGGNI